MTRFRIARLAPIAVLALVGAAPAGPESATTGAPVGPVNVVCPIGGEPADPAVTVEHEGIKVALCCAMCGPKWEAMAHVDKNMWLSRHADAGPVNGACPIGKEPIDMRTFAKHEGRTVGFCCPGCETKFAAWGEAEKDAYVASFSAGPVVNTVCPVAQHEINADGPKFAFMGKHVHLCCPDCVPAWIKMSNKERAASLEKAMTAASPE